VSLHSSLFTRVCTQQGCLVCRLQTSGFTLLFISQPSIRIGLQVYSECKIPSKEKTFVYGQNAVLLIEIS